MVCPSYRDSNVKMLFGFQNAMNIEIIEFLLMHHRFVLDSP